VRTSGLVHPATHDTMTWESPPPADFADLIRVLRARRADERRVGQ